ncbi:hypothetical protein LDENG_00297170 [Lucifuga dentata]|nr:hypothetical protein LDENG_00297170 [Lucifuga dentata]
MFSSVLTALILLVGLLVCIAGFAWWFENVLNAAVTRSYTLTRSHQDQQVELIDHHQRHQR